MRRLRRTLLIGLALLFLFEAWLWNKLEPVVERVVALVPIADIKARLAASIARLPPYATLVVFVVPAILLFPLKILGLWLIAQSQWLLAFLVWVFAKMVGVGVTAFLFEVTRPKLLQIGWFRWGYEQVLIGLAWAHRLADPVKERIRRVMRVFAPQRAGRTVRLIWRLRRRRMQAA